MWATETYLWCVACRVDDFFSSGDYSAWMEVDKASEAYSSVDLEKEEEYVQQVVQRVAEECTAPVAVEVEKELLLPQPPVTSLSSLESTDEWWQKVVAQRKRAEQFAFEQAVDGRKASSRK